MSTDNILYNDFFLGANSPEGFRSLFTQSYDPSDGWRVWIIKGGPGAGKSTAMRGVCLRARELGLYHERCFCSSDPDSLDAVIIPERRLAVYDGTAPHVMEPSLPGACENIVNFGEAWDSGKLYELRAGIVDLSAQCSARHSTARLWLRAAAAFRENTFLAAVDAADRGKIDRAAGSICAKYAPRHGSGRGRAEKRLFTAVTPRGVIMPGAAGFEKLGHRVVIDDPTGAASSALLDRTAELLTGSGVDIILGICSQSGRTEHLLARELSLLISASSPAHTFTGNTRVIHGERFFADGFLRSHRERVKLNRSGAADMTDSAVREMARAKSLHDRLEALYAQAMVYDRAGEIAQRLVLDVFR